MDIAEAADWFADTVVDGWDGSVWVSDVGYGDFLTYDRFITDRTFGIKKRMLLTPASGMFDPDTYPVVRTFDGKQWMVISKNNDIKEGEAYAASYLMMVAGYDAEIIEFQTEELASGQQGNVVEVVVGTTVCDVEQYGVRRSRDLTDVVYGSYEITLPGGITVSDDNEIRIGQDQYTVNEVSFEGYNQVARAMRRSISV